MTVDILMHIRETLSEHQRRNLLISLGNRRGGLLARSKSHHPHLIFVACDTRRKGPQELIKITQRAGYHARLVA